MMRKMLLTLLCLLSLSVMAQEQKVKPSEVKYCMNYADFQNNHWLPIDSLAPIDSTSSVVLSFEEGEFRVNTGVKDVDAVLKKQVLAVLIDKKLFVNCRNLRDDGVQLDASNYAQAYRYDGNKICVLAYHINTGALLLGVGTDISSLFVGSGALGSTMRSTSDRLWLNPNKLESFRCYLLESEANQKGRYPVTLMNDDFMEKLLKDDPDLLERYNAPVKKKNRLVASHILPILFDKQLIKE